MPYEVAAKNLMLDALRRAISHVGLHSGRPAKANELHGGRYKREPVEFDHASHGAIALKAAQSVTVPEASKVTHLGFWSAPSGGVLLAYGQVDPQEFKKNGVFIVDGANLDLNLS